MNLNMDAYLLLSIINTKLRDQYRDLETLCDDLNVDENLLKKKLENIGYFYNESLNAFVVKK